MATVTFTKMLKLAYQNGVISILARFKFDCELLSLQYADNTVLLVNTDTSSIQALKLLLCSFEFVSSLKISFH